MPVPQPIRAVHDDWSKRALRLWLSGIGDVRMDAHIRGEARRGDVQFVERSRHRQMRALGALGRVARGRVLFEHCWNTPTEAELNSCFVKRIELDADQARTARREKRPRSSVEATTLCVILPSLPPRLAFATGAKPMAAAPKGFYVLAPIMRTVLVVSGRLPRVPSTLWLRLLGRGPVLADAVFDLKRAHGRTALGGDTLKLLVEWRASLPPEADLSEEQREMAMNLEQWERTIKAEGRAEGTAKSVVAVLEARRIPLSSAQRARILACTDPSVLMAWVRDAVTAESAAELFASTRRPAGRRVRGTSSRKAV